MNTQPEIVPRGAWILYHYHSGQERERWYFHGRYGKTAALKFAGEELFLCRDAVANLDRVGSSQLTEYVYYVLTSLERKDKIDPLYKPR